MDNATNKIIMENILTAGALGDRLNVLETNLLASITFHLQRLGRTVGRHELQTIPFRESVVEGLTCIKLGKDGETFVETPSDTSGTKSLQDHMWEDGFNHRDLLALLQMLETIDE